VGKSERLVAMWPSEASGPTGGFSRVLAVSETRLGDLKLMYAGSAIFYMISSGSMTIEYGKTKVEMQPKKIYFVNDRTTYRITKNNSINTALMSGIFKWDKEVHGS